MLPGILNKARSLLGERRLTVVFHRGGWSPKLFAKLVAEGFDFLTYRKGHFRQRPKSRFREHKDVIDGRTIHYTLADQGVHLLGGKLRLRQVTRLSENGHQTPIITSRRDLPAIEVAFRMFERWRQENFFKYLREEYALDALVEYATEPDDAAREVPNPKWNMLNRQLRQARAAVKILHAEYGKKALLNSGRRRPAKRCTTLETRRAAVPRRLPVGQVVDGPVVKLAAERMHLTSLLKMAACQVESDIFRLVTPHCKRAADEGRSFVRNLSRIPIEVLQRYEKWKDIVAISGPDGLRFIKGFHDESLRGKWQGHRSSRLGLKYRLIYRIEERQLYVQVIDIAAHDYRRK